MIILFRGYIYWTYPLKRRVLSFTTDKGGLEISHAMTLKNYEELSKRLSEKLNIPVEEVFKALKEITREDVLRIAKNAPEEQEG